MKIRVQKEQEYNAMYLSYMSQKNKIIDEQKA
jgi:hypothetical protein